MHTLALMRMYISYTTESSSCTYVAHEYDDSETGLGLMDIEIDEHIRMQWNLTLNQIQKYYSVRSRYILPRTRSYRLAPLHIHPFTC